MCCIHNLFCIGGSNWESGLIRLGWRSSVALYHGSAWRGAELQGGDGQRSSQLLVIQFRHCKAEVQSTRTGGVFVAAMEVMETGVCACEVVCVWLVPVASGGCNHPCLSLRGGGASSWQLVLGAGQKNLFELLLPLLPTPKSGPTEICVVVSCRRWVLSRVPAEALPSHRWALSDHASIFVSRLSI